MLALLTLYDIITNLYRERISNEVKRSVFVLQRGREWGWQDVVTAHTYDKDRHTQAKQSLAAPGQMQRRTAADTLALFVSQVSSRDRILNRDTGKVTRNTYVRERCRRSLFLDPILSSTPLGSGPPV